MLMSLKKAAENICHSIYDFPEIKENNNKSWFEKYQLAFKI